MIWAVRENATVILDEKDHQRALMQLRHLVGLIGDRKVFLILFKWPDGLSTSEFAEPEDDFIQTTGTQQGLTVELMRAGELYVVGHRSGDTATIALARQDGSTLDVKQNEVLAPDEVRGLFTQYVEGGLDTTTWALRKIAVGEGADDEEHGHRPATSLTDDSHSGASPGIAANRSESTADSQDGAAVEKPLTLGE